MRTVLDGFSTESSTDMATPVSTSSAVDINIDNGEVDEAYSLWNCSIMSVFVVLLLVVVCVIVLENAPISSAVRIVFLMHQRAPSKIFYIIRYHESDAVGGWDRRCCSSFFTHHGKL
jgi:hypothetical protein